MDLFRFNNPNEPTFMEDGIFLNNLKSAMWIERYRAAGEFKIVGYASNGIQEQLPRGSFISHIDTQEIMVVENHELNDSRGQEPLVTVTGRSLETYLEQRVCGRNGLLGEIGYVCEANYTWAQAVELITAHILPGYPIDIGDLLSYFEVLHVVDDISVWTTRFFERGILYERLLELLAVDNLGIKTVRPGPYSPAVDQRNTTFVIHKGVDRSADIVLSHESGEIESADYLWSIKKLKNCAFVSGKWVSTFVDTDVTGYDRRILFVDASDIDNNYNSAPTDPALTDITAAMQVRGFEALAAHQEIALSKVEVSKSGKKSRFRQDYEVGDIITVRGDYAQTNTLRITEYVEIDDEKGSSGYPTLSNPYHPPPEGEVS
jgi:hypothetical protein